MTTAVKPPGAIRGGRTAVARDGGLVALTRWLVSEAVRSWALDATVCLVVLLIGILQVTGRASANDPFAPNTAPTWVVVSTVLCQSLPLLIRRRATIAVLAVLLVACITQIAFGFAMRSDLGLLVALYSVCRYRDGRQVVWAAIATLAVPLFAVFRLPPLMQQRYLGLFFLSCAMVAAVALGLAAKSRQAKLQALADRAARLEVEREQRAQLATVAERTRVSREMHDIVGHNLAVITGLADGAAKLAAHQPTNTAQTTRAFELIADTSRQALSELRRTLGVLRDSDTGRPRLTPQPDLAEVPRLIERVQGAGPRVIYTTDGDLTHLTPGLQLTVYRVIQEALTNILKHAQTANLVTIAVTREEDAVAVTVHDDAPVRGTLQSDSEGHGLLGLRERAGLTGGTLTAGPAPERGWTVSALLPIDTVETP